VSYFTQPIRFVAATIVAVALCARSDSAGSHDAATLLAEYRVLSTKYANSVPGWRPQTPSTGSLVFIATDEYAALDDHGHQYRAQRETYADELFRLAKRAAGAGQLSLAFQWTTEAVRENPDHLDARRVLGYQKRDGRWLSAYGARMADAGKVWHSKFGWIIPSDVPRYEAGERLVAGRWIPAADDAARHSDIKKGWQVRTDHFLVITNHSLEAAADLAARLERLFQVWRQLFAGFYLSEREVSELFAGEREPRAGHRPYRVYYHRDRDEYNAALRRRQPRIGETLGIYFDADREAHFFAGDDQDAGTLYHEAVHQLFQESRPAVKQIGRTANFWIIEGVATYFETLTEHNDPEAGLYYTIGEASAGRIPSARERLAEGFYVPLAELSRLGKADLQARPDIAKLYSQAAGLSAFLMQDQNGRYREPMVQYLKVVYSGRDSSGSLAESVGHSFPELDTAYRRYLESLP
jgi:hypothetical protein